MHRSINATFLSLLMLGFASPSLAQEASNTLDKIKSAGEIVLGYRETSIPFSYIEKDQTPKGYSIDLCMRIADAVKEKVGNADLKVRFVPVSPQTRIPLLVNGTIDMECGSTTNNLTRQEQVSFLPTTFITGTKILVKADSPIKSVDDLADHKIALPQGTTNERAIKEYIEKHSLNADILNVKDHAEGFLALQNDRVDAYSTDHILLAGLLTKAPDPEGYKIVGDFYSYDPYALMLRRNDADFQLLGAKILADLFRSREIEAIYKKWFEPFPNNAKVSEPPSDLLKASWQLNSLP